MFSDIILVYLIGIIFNIRTFHLLRLAAVSSKLCFLLRLPLI